MNTEKGYNINLSDNTLISIAPKAGTAQCSIEHKGMKICIDVLQGSFKTESTPSDLPKNQIPHIVGFAPVEINLGDMENRAENPTILGCRVSGGCCNCGSGWICG